MQSNNLLRAGCGKSPPKTNKICLICLELNGTLDLRDKR